MSWSPQKKAKWNRDFEKHFRSHRDTPDGGNFVYWNKKPSEKELDNYRDGYDRLFPDAPGAGV